jgi:hypothetical protein
VSSASPGFACSCSVRRAYRLRGCRPSRNCQKTDKEMRTSMRACAQELGALRGQRPGERCPLMALSGHATGADECLLSGVKRT